MFKEIRRAMERISNSKKEGDKEIVEVAYENYFNVFDYISMQFLLKNINKKEFERFYLKALIETIEIHKDIDFKNDFSNMYEVYEKYTKKYK